ncbi:MAG: hypothetical protein ACJAR2_000288 [Ilumatobacter sp.]|jgi:hypothetical protein
MPTHPVHPPEWIDSAPIVVDESIVINASPAAVWVHVVDHAAWPEWFTALDKIEPGSLASGIGGSRKVFAKPLSLDEEFTAWDENEHFAFAIVESKIPILSALAESVRLESVDEGCRVTYRQGVEARRGFGWLMGKAWAKPAKDLPIALQNLKRLVESADANADQ